MPISERVHGATIQPVTTVVAKIRVGDSPAGLLGNFVMPLGMAVGQLLFSSANWLLKSYESWPSHHIRNFERRGTRTIIEHDSRVACASTIQRATREHAAL